MWPLNTVDSSVGEALEPQNIVCCLADDDGGLSTLWEVVKSGGDWRRKKVDQPE
jgi:hypothetical protein